MDKFVNHLGLFGVLSIAQVFRTAQTKKVHQHAV